MASTSETNDLLSQARCVGSCLSAGNAEDVLTYLLAKIVGGSTDPDVLVDSAQRSGYCCLPGATLDEELVYLLSQLTGEDPDPNHLLSESRCWDACIPAGMVSAAAVSLLMQILSVTDLKAVLEEAKCMKCLSAGQHSMVRTYLVGALLNATEQFLTFMPPVGFISQGIEGWYGPQVPYTFGLVASPTGSPDGTPVPQSLIGQITWVESNGAHYHGDLSYFYANANFGEVVQLYANGAGLTSIHGLNLMPKLEHLELADNDLSSLDLTGCSALLYLKVNNNTQLSNHLFLTGCTLLITLLAHNCGIFGAITWPAMPALQTLDIGLCGGITSIDLSASTNLLYLDISLAPTGLNLLTTLDLTNNTKLVSLYLSGQAALATLTINSAVLQVLDVSSLPMTVLDVSGWPLLNTLVCSDMNKNLGYSHFSVNFMTSPPVTTLIAQRTHWGMGLKFDLMGTGWVKIDVSGCISTDGELHLAAATPITYLDISGSNITSIISSGPYGELAYLNISNTAIANADMPAYSSLSHLQTLLATGCPNLSGYQDLSSCAFIEEVRFDGSPLLTDVLFPVVETNLRFIQASNCNLGFNQPHGVVSGLFRAYNLTHLDLHGNSGLKLFFTQDTTNPSFPYGPVYWLRMSYLNLSGGHLIEGSVFEALRGCLNATSVGGVRNGFLDVSGGTNWSFDCIHSYGSNCSYRQQLNSAGWTVMNNGT